MNPSAGLKANVIPLFPEELEKISVLLEAPLGITANFKESVIKSCRKFNSGQRKIFDNVVNEILPGVTEKGPFASVHHPFNREWSRSRTYFLEAVGGNGNGFILAAIQAKLQFRARRVIALLLLQLLHHFWKEGEQRTRYSKYQSHALKIVCILYQGIQNRPSLFVVLT